MKPPLVTPLFTLIAALLIAPLLTVPRAAAADEAAETIDLGSRLELFVDDYLIDKTTGDIASHLHRPKPGEVVLTTDKPWEGNTCAYYTIFQDADLYRMYYRGSHADEKTQERAHREVTCYAESRDGIHWTRPNLRLFEWEGSRDNNIILDGLGTHCFVAFRDENPDAKGDALYKGISRGEKGLHVFKSLDGIRWSLIKEEPVITKGAFDSQNLAFWDPHTKLYVDYHRAFVDGVRSIMTCTSRDFVNWTEPVLLKYPGAPNQHLYTNAIRPYPRAPHIRIGFPTRYLPKGSRVEPIFMSSRDGVTFKRFDEPVIPRTAPADRDGNRSNYMANGLVQLPGTDRELTVYATEAYYKGPSSRLRQFTYRVDGFVSLRAQGKGGQAITRPLTFTGKELVINFSTHDGGHITVELQTAAGEPITGFTRAEAAPCTGDEIGQVVKWKSGADVSKLAGKPVRLRFICRNADLFSIRFR